ncbi:hypothetical protein Tco_1199259 [Tanacetum coccineum]
MTVIGEVNEMVTDLATHQRQETNELQVRCKDAQDDRALLRAQVYLLTRERRYFCSMASSYKREVADVHQAWAHFKSKSQSMEAQIRALQRDVDVLQRQRIRDEDRELLLRWLSMKLTEAVEMVMIAMILEVAEGQSELLMKSVFDISNYIVACHIKFATFTLFGNSLTWWNSHIKTVGHDAAYRMPWKTLKKMMTD